MVLTREGVTAIIPEDTAGLASRLGSLAYQGESSEFQHLPAGALQTLYPAFAQQKARSNIIAISGAGSTICSVLPPDILDSFTEQINAELAQGLQQPVENLGASLWDEFIDSNLSEDDHMEIRRRLSECDELLRGLTEVLDILANLSMSLGGIALHDIVTTGLSRALIAAGISEIVLSRYTLSQNLLFAALFALSESDPAVDDEESEQLLQILARAFVIYHRYRVLKWVCEQTGEEARERSRLKGKGNGRGGKRPAGNEVLSEGLGGLKVRDPDLEEGDYDSDGYNSSYSLLHSLFARQFELPIMSGSINAILSASMEFLNTADLVSVDLEIELELGARGQDLQLIQSILMDGHLLLAGKMSELYEFGSGTAYLRGRCWLDSGDWEGAAGLLQRAVAGCRGEFDTCL